MTLQNLTVAEGIAMEKSWKDFWTTGKVEDYLTYRNRLEQSVPEMSENCHRQNEADKQGKKDYFSDSHQSLR